MVRILKKIRDFLNYATTDKRWNVLINLIKKNNYTKIAEIGTFKGENAYKIKKALPKIEINCFDPYPPHLCRSKDSFKNNENDNLYKKVKKKLERVEVNLDRITGEEASKKTPNETYDLVFIDAIHSYKNVKQDIKLWYPKVKKGGILCGHDYNIQFFGVIKAVVEELGDEYIYLYDDSVWVYHKK